MKIYLFNPETGTYLGEDFADEAAMPPGTFVVPADATTMAPPETEAGMVPIFDCRAKRWELLPVPPRAKRALSARLDGSNAQEVHR